MEPREDDEGERSTARDDGRRPGEAFEHFLVPRTGDSGEVNESTGGDAGPDRPPQEPPLGGLQGTPGQGVGVCHDRRHAHDTDEEGGRLVNVEGNCVRRDGKCDGGGHHTQPAPVSPIVA